MRSFSPILLLLCDYRALLPHTAPIEPVLDLVF